MLGASRVMSLFEQKMFFERGLGYYFRRLDGCGVGLLMRP